MSYILDALKKADAERELGTVPHLHARAAPAAPSPAGADALRAWTWAAASAAIVVVAAVAWWAFRPEPFTARAPALTAPAPVPAAPAPRTEPVAEPVKPAAAALIEAPRPAPPPARLASAAANPAPPALDDLPEEVRRELPALTLGGAIYSGQPSARVLIVNGELRHEGDTVAPGLVLLSIGPRSALLRWRGTRFTVKY